MNVELKQKQARAIGLSRQLESVLADLDTIDAKVAAIHVDVAITSLCENYRIPRPDSFAVDRRLQNCLRVVTTGTT